MAAAAAYPPITLKEGIARFEREEWERRVREEEMLAERDGREKREIPPVVAASETYVKLFGMLPPIGRIDKEISSLLACEHLGLSTNAIDRISPGLKELKNLKILSLGRNRIKKLEQLDIPQLEQLWISYNMIDKLTGLDKLKNLRVLYMSNNLISGWTEIDRLGNQCPDLVDVLFYGNPIQTTAKDEPEYRLMLLERLPKLVKIDGVPVEVEEREEVAKRKNLA